MIYHILNGDALLERLVDTTIDGEFIVFREALIDGPTIGNSLSQLVTNRESYLKNTYSISDEEYNSYKSEILKLTEIKEGSTVYLWFEQDLFCQLNFWAALYYLKEIQANYFLVLPCEESPCGFASCSHLEKLIDHKIALDNVGVLTTLWPIFQSGNMHKLQSQLTLASTDFQFLKGTEKIIRDFHMERPLAWVTRQIHEQPDITFPKLFTQFVQEMPQFGLGDLQVKNMYDTVMAEKPNWAITLATEPDLPLIYAMLKDAAQRLSSMQVDQWQYWTEPPASKRKWLENGVAQGEYYFIHIDTTLAFLFRYSDKDIDYWGEQKEDARYVHSLVTTPAFVGQKLGRKVLEYISTMAISEGVYKLRLDCHAGNKKLCHYYESQGFVKVGEKLMPHSLNNLYEKTLKK